MNNNIDNILDKVLNKSKMTDTRKMLEEPKHVLVCNGFKTWKVFTRKFISANEAYRTFNETIEQLSQFNNIIIDNDKSKVSVTDIIPWYCAGSTFEYKVQIYWRDAH